MTRSGLACAVCLAVFGVIGCGDDDDTGNNGAKEDGGSSHGKPIVLPGKDAGDDESDDTFTLGDAGMRLVDCEDAEEGAPCGPNGGLLCLAGSCVASRCGDGFVDPALEECDDENTEPGDGCDPDCAWDCKDDSMCDDGAACNGKERCLINHTCELGLPAGDGTTCMSAAIADGQCRQGTCTPAGCGDKETKGAEQCDDGNDTPADGCEIDCTFSCEDAADCDDGSLCTGTESCDVASHVCKPGEALSCRDDSECTVDSCDAELGCQFTAIDEDGDGHSPDSLPCGDDCDDKRPDVYPGHPELCDDIDHDCVPDGSNEVVPTWYEDCDGDGYARLDAPSVVGCEMPPATHGCPGWTTRVPDRDDVLSYDCNDAEIDAYPGQNGWFTEYAQGTTGWEYNCNSMLDLLYSNVGVSATALCTSFGISTCAGPSGWVGEKPPKCGLSADYTRCSYVFGRDAGFGNCTRTVFDQQEQCR